MPEVAGIRFKQCGKIYNFNTNGIRVKPGMWVVVESEMGLSLGFILKISYSTEPPEQQFKKILRIATVQDMEAERNNCTLEIEAGNFCKERANSLNLLMKVIDTEATLDRKRLIFYFSAEGRIDFRELVRDLASKFKTRIEMRQVGVRDEVKCIGGIGCCGREVCCKAFLTSFEPISIRMAKKQELVLNPGKLSGICGRLMCCLGYEIKPSSKKKTKKAPAGTKTGDNSKIPEKSRDEQKTEKRKSDGTVKLSGKTGAKTATSLRKDIQPQKQIEPAQEKVQPPQPQKTSKKTTAKEDRTKPQTPKRKDQGKPFSKRKKFWKKKKR